MTTDVGHRRCIFDTHLHIFPDKVAAAALPALQEKSSVEPRVDGTLQGLLAAMKQNGVTRSVVQPVATRPQSVAAVSDWAAALPAGRVLAFGAMHPGHPDPGAEIARLAALGLRGVKLHSEFQAFHPDDDRMAPIYEPALAHGVVIVFHAAELRACARRVSRAHRGARAHGRLEAVGRDPRGPRRAPIAPARCRPGHPSSRRSSCRGRIVYWKSLTGR